MKSNCDYIVTISFLGIFYHFDNKRVTNRSFIVITKDKQASKRGLRSGHNQAKIKQIMRQASDKGDVNGKG